MQLGVCVCVCTATCWGGDIGRRFIIRLNTLAACFWQSCIISYLSSFTNHDHLENTYFIYHKHIIEKYMTEPAWNRILQPWGHLAHSDNLSSKTPLKTQRSFWLTAKMRCGILSADMPDCHFPSMCVRACSCVCVSESEVRAKINHGPWLIQLDLLT